MRPRPFLSTNHKLVAFSGAEQQVCIDDCWLAVNLSSAWHATPVHRHSEGCVAATNTPGEAGLTPPCVYYTYQCSTTYRCSKLVAIIGGDNTDYNGRRASQLTSLRSWKRPSDGLARSMSAAANIDNCALLGLLGLETLAERRLTQQGCPQDVKSQDRDETETFQKTYRDRSVAV